MTDSDDETKSKVTSIDAARVRRDTQRQLGAAFRLRFYEYDDEVALGFSSDPVHPVVFLFDPEMREGLAMTKASAEKLRDGLSGVLSSPHAPWPTGAHESPTFVAVRALETLIHTLPNTAARARMIAALAEVEASFTRTAMDMMSMIEAEREACILDFLGASDAAPATMPQRDVTRCGITVVRARAARLAANIEKATEPSAPPAPLCLDCKKPVVQPGLTGRDHVGEFHICEPCVHARAAKGVVQIPYREVGTSTTGTPTPTARYKCDGCWTVFEAARPNPAGVNQDVACPTCHLVETSEVPR